MAMFKVGEKGIYVIARGTAHFPLGTPRLRLGAVVCVLFVGHFERGDELLIDGRRRAILQPADYIVIDVDDHEVVAGVMRWQLVKRGDPDVVSEIADGDSTCAQVNGE